MSATKPTLRIATTDEDRAAVYRLRYELYVEQQGLFLDQADHENRWLRDGYDESSTIILAEDDGRCVGTSRMSFGAETEFSEASKEDYDFARFDDLLEPADFSVITRLMVLPAYRGGDLGTRLFAESFRLAAEKGAELVLGSCELHLINYYWPLGFRPFGQLSNHPTNGVLVRIAAVLGDLEHVRNMDSPVTEALARRRRSNENVPAILERLADSPALLSEARLGSEAFQGELNGRLGESAACELFAELTAEQKAQLLRKSHLLRCAPGDALFYDGQASRTLYILLSGSLEIRDPATGKQHLERAGALVGEVALLGSARRLGNVVTGSEGASVLALNDRTLRDLIAERSQLTAFFLLYAARELSQKMLARSASARAEAAPSDAAQAVTAQAATAQAPIKPRRRARAYGPRRPGTDSRRSFGSHRTTSLRRRAVNLRR